MSIARVISAHLFLVLSDFFQHCFFSICFLVCSCFLIWDMNICEHFDVNINGMEVASLSVSTADEGIVFVLADSSL